MTTEEKRTWREYYKEVWKKNAEKCPCKYPYKGDAMCSAISNYCDYDHCPFLYWKNK